MRARRRRGSQIALFCAALCVAVLVAKSSRAEVVARQTMAGVEVRVDRDRSGALSLVVPGQANVRLAAGGRVTAALVPMGTAGAWVVRVDGDQPAAALVTASAQQAPTVLFAGALAPASEDPGEAHRFELIVRDLSGRGAPDVVLAERRDDVRLCSGGRPLVAARAVNPATMRFANVTLNPLRADLAESPFPAARTVVPIAMPGMQRSALPSLNVGIRVANGVVQSGALGLTDHAPETSVPIRPHDFVAGAVTLAGLRAERIVLTAPAAPARLPSSFTLLLDDQRVDVTVPPTLLIRPGERLAVPLAPARTLHCVAMIATEPPSTGAPVVPNAPTALAELEIWSEVDRAPDAALGSLVRALDSAAGDEAAQLLEALGAPAIAPVALALPTLAPSGARRAIHVLSAARTAASATALVGALGRLDVADDAQLALVRMGATALDALGSVAAIDPRAAAAIETLSAPIELRLRAMANALSGDVGPWRRARRSVVSLVRRAVAANALGPWLAALPEAVGPRIRGLVIAAEASGSAEDRAVIAARARSITTADFDDRYRLLMPLRGDAEGAALVAHVATDDSDADLRAEAVRVLADTPSAREAVVHALRDPVPRVRAAAVAALARDTSARAQIADRLVHDTWPSVRARAALSLTSDAAAVPILLHALDDPSVVTVRAILESLTRSPGTGFSSTLVRYAEDPRRNPELRQEAVGVLHARCERGALEGLERIANSQLDPALPPTEQAVGLAALAALAHIDPARARDFLRRSEANSVAAAAVERALRQPCPRR